MLLIGSYAILEGKAQPDLGLIQASIWISALEEDSEVNLLVHLHCHHHLSLLKALHPAPSSPSPQRSAPEPPTKYTADFESLHASLAAHFSQNKT